MPDAKPHDFCPVPRQCARPSGRISGARAMATPPTDYAAVRKEDDPQRPRKAVICFECGLISLVPQAAFSTRCHHCSAYISLDNVVLHKRSHKTLVQTRGDVTVKAGADFKGVVIKCHNLFLTGKLSGSFDCSGSCVMKTDQLIGGTVRAHTLVVEKKATVTLARPAETHNAQICGIFNGSIQAAGTVTVCKNGKVLGDIRSPKLVIEEGGTHFGHYTKLSPV